MDYKKIVVENTLEPYIEYLKNNGYDVHKLYLNKNANNITSPEYEAIILSNKNKMNTTQGNINNLPVIETKGKSPQDVYNELRNLR
ncbi:YkuS family protein [Thermohalobacter berrensis]|uniref:YkuS family protein n=1 Tax=Thermohalobacter berrensis TaxID=99594 RepID=A0A419SZG3_9FIRM|nr:YkuS family protein [Thermohalobacter berrensis]RKD30605.1 hypothetical protein BET03_04505 [Thermohalobacter berrensis]